MKLTIEDKREIIKLWRTGRSRTYLALQYEVGKRTIEKIIGLYQYHGEKSIYDKKGNTEYSLKFKFKIITEAQSGKSINSIANEYMISDGMIHSWIKKYKELGYNGLITQKRGRRPMVRKIKEKKKYSSEKEEIEDLRKINQQLEMENELLKKLDALVQERIKREKKKK